MNNKSLVFTEKTIGRHTKRLQKELAKINHDLKLSEAQNMLSRILGMKDYHELKQVLKFEDKEENINNELFIRSTLIPEHYKQHHITQKKRKYVKVCIVR